MTTKTVSTKITTAHEPTYADLLSRARQLFHTDVETRFEMAVIFSKMLKLKTADEIAEDTDMTPGGVARIARVADFWGSIRIKPDGKKTASWYLYDRVAHDVMIDDVKRQLIKRSAPKGLATIRSMLRGARRVSVDELNEVVNGKRASRQSTARAPRANRVDVDVTDGSAEVEETALDADAIVASVMRSLDAAVEALDQLESLSDADAKKVRVRLNAVTAQVVNLTKVVL